MQRNPILKRANPILKPSPYTREIGHIEQVIHKPNPLLKHSTSLNNTERKFVKRWYDLFEFSDTDAKASAAAKAESTPTETNPEKVDYPDEKHATADHSDNKPTPELNDAQYSEKEKSLMSAVLHENEELRAKLAKYETEAPPLEPDEDEMPPPLAEVPQTPKQPKRSPRPPHTAPTTKTERKTLQEKDEDEDEEDAGYGGYATAEEAEEDEADEAEEADGSERAQLELKGDLSYIPIEVKPIYEGLKSELKRIYAENPVPDDKVKKYCVYLIKSVDQQLKIHPKKVQSGSVDKREMKNINEHLYGVTKNKKPFITIMLPTNNKSEAYKKRVGALEKYVVMKVYEIVKKKLTSERRTKAKP